MEKSADAFRTISEVADDLDVPKHVLRFWEGKFLQLRPLKRGGGRRYYRPGDVELLRGIRRLLYDEGYTIKGVQKVLREQGVDFVKGMVDPAAASKGSEAEAGSGRQPYLNGSAGHASTSKAKARSSPAAGLPESSVKELKKALEALEAARKLTGGGKGE